MTGDDPSEEEDERTIELSALAAIYPELHFQSDDDEQGVKHASLKVPVEPLHPVQIRTPVVLEQPPDLKNGVQADGGYGQNDSHQLENLPPLLVQMSLSQGYPLSEPPAVVISTENSWLDRVKLKELEGVALSTWQELGQDQMLYAFIDRLREEAENGLGLSKTLEVQQEMVLSLLDFDLQARRSKFENGTYECGVCLEPKKGTACHRLLLCSHVFCLDCLHDFYTTCITEGDVGSVKCLAPKCPGTAPKDDDVQREIAIEPSELIQMRLPNETVQRYITLKRKKALESDRNTVYCPRQWCQGPARHKLTNPNYTSQAASNDPPPLPKPSERLAICIDCSFAFCLVCKASWHGEYFTCFPRSQFEITVEEKASEDYMLLHTQGCPTCDARAQKTHGCNHMICFKCDTHFCYLCGSYLEKGNPYEHFNNNKGTCYMRLWELEEGDDGEIGHGFAGGRDGVVMSDDEDDEAEEEEAEFHVVFEEPPPAPIQPPPNGHRRMLNRGNRAPGGAGAPRALRRFLEMVQQDVEDEWDSDEMSDDEVEQL